MSLPFSKLENGREQRLNVSQADASKTMARLIDPQH